MAHAGTMVGGSAQTKQSGKPWPAIMLTLAVVVATIAGVWLASSAGLVGGTAKPAADRSMDQIEAQRGAITLSGGSIQAYDEQLNGILDKAHATPYVAAAVTPSSDRILAYDENLKFFDRAQPLFERVVDNATRPAPTGCSRPRARTLAMVASPFRATCSS
jgi:hypothetical protein